jgi:hypothetical protein
LLPSDFKNSGDLVSSLTMMDFNYISYVESLIQGSDLLDFNLLSRDLDTGVSPLFPYFELYPLLPYF